MLALLKPVRVMISGTVAPFALSFWIRSILSGSSRGFRPTDSLRLGLGDTVHLAPTTDVVLELGDESKTQ